MSLKYVFLFIDLVKSLFDGWVDMRPSADPENFVINTKFSKGVHRSIVVAVGLDCD